MKSRIRLIVTLALAVTMHGAFANDQMAYETRVGTELATLFDSLDRGRDAQVSRDEARGDLNFTPLFDEMDVNRNGFVTKDELRAYLDLRYGRHAADAAAKALTARAETLPRLQ